jgi:hypothetical protein
VSDRDPTICGISPKKNQSPKKMALSLPPVFDRVSSDTLNYGGRAKCPVAASRYTVAARCAAGVAGNSGAFAPPRHRPRILFKNRKRPNFESIGPSRLDCRGNVCW